MCGGRPGPAESAWPARVFSTVRQPSHPRARLRMPDHTHRAPSFWPASSVLPSGGSCWRSRVPDRNLNVVSGSYLGITRLGPVAPTHRRPFGPPQIRGFLGISWLVRSPRPAAPCNLEHEGVREASVKIIERGHASLNPRWTRLRSSSKAALGQLLCRDPTFVWLFPAPIPSGAC